MDRPLVLVIEDAKSVLMSTVITIKNQTGLPSTILDGILSGVLADVRKDACSEIAMAAAQEKKEKKEGEEILIGEFSYKGEEI